MKIEHNWGFLAFGFVYMIILILMGIGVWNNPEVHTVTHSIEYVNVTDDINCFEEVKRLTNEVEDLKNTMGVKHGK